MTMTPLPPGFGHAFTITMTVHDVREGVRRGENNWECLARRFKEVWGLTFTSEQLETGKHFKFQERADGEEFKVTYFGPQVSSIGRGN